MSNCKSRIGLTRLVYLAALNYSASGKESTRKNPNNVQRKTKRFVVVYLSLIFIKIGCFGQTITVTKLDGSKISSGRIDSIVTSLMDSANVPGLNLSIINNNQVKYIKSYGLKDLKTSAAQDTATVFPSCSFSKAVFAYLVMKLVDRQILDLDIPIEKYLEKPLPEYERYVGLKNDDRWKMITSRMLLSHTAGFPNWKFLNPRGNNQVEIFFTPGSRYAYSGEGIYLLQLVVETKTKRKLDDLAKELVFIPLNMRRTGFAWRPDFEDNYSFGYSKEGKQFGRGKPGEKSADAAGSMETTIADYSRFIVAVMNGKGLSAKAKKEMLSYQIRIYSEQQFPSLNESKTTENNKIKLGYGLGWGLFICKFGKAFFKEGHDEGWQHHNVNFPDKKTSIIIMTNSNNGESIFKELLGKLIGDTCTPWKWENYYPYNYK